MKTVLGSLILLLSVLVSVEHAAANSGVTYQGRILKPDGSPLAGASVQFRMQIRTPDSANCLMYEEIRPAIDMRETNGAFSLTINDGSGTRMDTTGLTLDRIFANRGSFALGASSCTAGLGNYTPNDSDGRNLAVMFKDETMAAWEPIPAQKINFVPLAFEAKQVGGFTADSLLRVVSASGDPVTGLSPLSNSDYTKLLDIIAGNSNAYAKSGYIGGAASPSLSSAGTLSWTGSAWAISDPLSGVQPFAKTALPACATGQVLRNNGSGGLECVQTPGLNYSSGNIGIGATTPTEKLVVANGASAIKFSPGWFTGTGSWIDLDTTGPSGIGSGGAGVNPWIAYAASTDHWLKGAASGDIVYRNAQGKRLLFGINNSTGDAPPIMTLTGSKVGIGTLNPSTQLQVTSDGDTAITIASNADSRVAQLSIYRGPGKTSSIGPSASNSFDFWTQENIPMLFSINSNERMRIDSSGDVHLGQSNPGMKLDVNGNVVVGNAYKLYVGAVAVCDNTGCSSPSDRRYKENITPLESSLEKILKLQGVGYDWIDKSAFNERHQIGFIAQDLEKVFPEVVKTDAKTGFKTVVYDHLTAPIVEALKILTRKLSQKPDRVEVTAAVNELKLENAKLKKDNELIKSYLCSKDPASSLCE